MQQTNNFVPTIVERSARQATRIVSGGNRAIRWHKKNSHRSYRRMMKSHLHEIILGSIDFEEYDDSPGKLKCTGWDIA